jgi:hypothetical protein
MSNASGRDSSSEPKDMPHEQADTTISRRQFIHGVMIASATAAGLAALPSTADGVPPSIAIKDLTSEQVQKLTSVLNQIVPGNGVMPAAGDLGVARFIGQALEAAPHLRHHILGVLAALPEGQAFTQLPDTAATDAMLHRLESEQRDSFDLLVQATYVGYYSHARVQEILGWIDRVDAEYQIEPFDVASLEVVRQRGVNLTCATFVRSNQSRGEDV